MTSSEQLHATGDLVVIDQPWAAETQQASGAAARRYVSGVAEHIPEVASEADTICSSADTLIDQYKVDPEFFAESNRSAIFVSLALAAAKVQTEKNPSVAARRQAFIASAVFLLTANYSSRDTDDLAAYRRALNADADAGAKAMQDFEQREVSARLHDFVEDSGLLDTPRRKLGLEQESPYSFRALSIGSNTPARDVFVSPDTGLKTFEINDWDMGLRKRGEDFARRFDGGPALAQADAFATPSGRIYVPLATAEAMLSPRLTIGSRHTVHTGHIVKHEYVHTQAPVGVEYAFGTLLEEYRAKHYSGDTMSYRPDMKLFANVASMAGIDLPTLFMETEAYPTVQSRPGIYERIGRAYGVESIAELAAAHPLGCEDVVEPEIRTMLQALGTHEEIALRITARLQGAQRADTLARKIQRYSGLLGVHNLLQDYGRRNFPNA